MLQRLDSSLFGWQEWRAGSIVEVWGVRHREQSLVAHAALLRQHAIGWCPADMVPCRPKPGWVAVMFALPDGREFWTHLTGREFAAIFGGDQA